MSALELRDTLTARFGLALPATLVFDYPSPAAIADYLANTLAASVASTEVAGMRPVGMAADPSRRPAPTAVALSGIAMR